MTNTHSPIAHQPFRSSLQRVSKRLFVTGLNYTLSCTLLLASLALQAVAQQPADSSITTSSSPSSVPHLVRFSGTATDLNGKALNGTVGITFLLYSSEQGGSPLWLETQNVQADANGRFTVQLGATKPDGVATDLFTSGEARWLGVQISGQAERLRVLLVSVPYALKAGDAETIGGLPASAFVLANGAQTGSASGAKGQASPNPAAKNSAPPVNPSVTGTGAAGYIPVWDTTSDIVDSLLFQKGSAIGINTIAPAATLDVNGKAAVRDTLTLVPKTTDPTLSVSGTAFKVDSTGKVTFVIGQTFPGAGTITGITTATGSGLAGGGTSGTLNLKIPAAGITTAMLANPKITLNANAAGGITTPGAMTLGGTYTIGLKACLTNQILQYNGTAWGCAALGSGSGTVTSVASGAGLTGGPITTSGTLSIASAGVTNAMLAHNSLTVTPGTGLTGGGSVALGGSTTLSVNPSVVPELAVVNTFSNDQIISVNDSNYAFQVVDSGTGSVGAYMGANYIGAVGEASSSGTYSAGIAGYETSFTGINFGMEGMSNSTSGIGVFGSANSGSSTGLSFLGFYSTGTWGDSGNNEGLGLIGTADNGFAFIAANNSWSYTTSTFVNEETSNASGLVFVTEGGGFGGQCIIDVSGNLSCTGTVSPVVPVTGSRQVAMNTISLPEHWFEDIGSGQLSNGTGVVNIESVFGETVNTGVDYHVFLTPNGDCKGLYVAQKSATSFIVRELGGGNASIGFDYRIVAKRKGYEQLRLVDKTKEINAPRPKHAATSGTTPKPTDFLKARQQHMPMAQLARPTVPAR